MMRYLAPLCLLLFVSVGCKDKKVPAEQTVSSVEPAQGESPPTAALEPSSAQPKSLDKERLTAVFSGLWCITKRRDRQGVKELLAKHNYETVSQWAADWSGLSATDSKWAEETMVRTINSGCN